MSKIKSQEMKKREKTRYQEEKEGKHTKNQQIKLIELLIITYNQSIINIEVEMI